MNCNDLQCGGHNTRPPYCHSIAVHRSSWHSQGASILMTISWGQPWDQRWFTHGPSLIKNECQKTDSFKFRIGMFTQWISSIKLIMSYFCMKEEICLKIFRYKSTFLRQNCLKKFNTVDQFEELSQDRNRIETCRKQWHRKNSKH